MVFVLLLPASGVGLCHSGEFRCACNSLRAYTSASGDV